MTKLQVGREFNALCRTDIAVSNEDHVRDGPAREHDTTDELADEIEAAVLIGYSHDDAHGDVEHGDD